MKIFLGTVLSIIAVGVLLIAYGLLGRRAGAASIGIVGSTVPADAYQLARPMPVNDVVSMNGVAPTGGFMTGAPAQAVAYRTADVRPVPTVYVAPHRTAT